MQPKEEKTPDSRPLTECLIREMKPGDFVLRFFMLRAKNVRKTRTGREYLELALCDSTGRISGKVWSDTLKRWGQDFAVGDCVKVEGRVEAYNDQAQLVVEKIRRAELTEPPDASTLVRISPYDPEEAFSRIQEIALSLKPEGLSAVVNEILVRHAEAFKTFPAAGMVHHAYRGGLVEHVLTVVRRVQAVLALEEHMNPHVALAGAILHDIGKVRELNEAGGRTSEGRLLGHIVIGTAILRETAQALGHSDLSELIEVEHIMLSHHGEPQFGAVVRPHTREALLVHFMDNLDSKLKIMEEALETQDSEGFSSYNKWLQGRAYAGSPPGPEEEHTDDRS